jgi:hypothetical protein
LNPLERGDFVLAFLIDSDDCFRAMDRRRQTTVLISGRICGRVDNMSVISSIRLTAEIDVFS